MSSANERPRPLAEHAPARSEQSHSIGTTDPVQRVLARLPSAKRNGTGWLACCPVHDDSKPSLSISQGNDGRALVHCFAGCTPESIVASLGLAMPDLMPPRSSAASPSAKLTSKKPKQQVFATAREAVAALEVSRGPRSALWTYHSADGDQVGVVVRWDCADGKKTIMPISRNGEGWTFKAMHEPRPLYRLPGLLNRADVSDPVLVVEGEKCVDAVAGLGFSVTTSSGGSNAARKTDWRPLAGKQVVILPDHDAAGAHYATDVTVCLGRISPPAFVKTCAITTIWPDAPSGADIADYVAAQQSAGESDDSIRADIESLVNSAVGVEATGVGPVLTRAADIKPQRLTWFWPNRIPLGKLIVFAGDPSLGKSLITTDIAARVSTGTPWPDAQFETNEAGSVLLLSAEDDPEDTIVPRLKAAAADLTRIHLMSTIRQPDGSLAPFTLEYIGMLEAALQEMADARLVVIDPISAFLGRADSHKNAEVRGLLAPLSALAQKYRVSVVAVTHLTKSYGGKAMYRAMGSLAFVAAARAAWVVVADPDDERKQRRFLLSAKSNLGPQFPGLAYHVHAVPVDELGLQPCVAWSPDPVTVNADELFARETEKNQGRGAVQAAADWLQELLGGGPMQINDIKSDAQEAQVSWSSVRRAKEKLGIIVRRKGFGPGGGWSWMLPPPKDAQVAIDAQGNAMSTYEEVEHLCSGSPDIASEQDSDWGEL